MPDSTKDDDSWLLPLLLVLLFVVAVGAALAYQLCRLRQELHCVKRRQKKTDHDVCTEISNASQRRHCHETDCKLRLRKALRCTLASASRIMTDIEVVSVPLAPLSTIISLHRNFGKVYASCPSDVTLTDDGMILHQPGHYWVQVFAVCVQGSIPGPPAPSMLFFAVLNNEFQTQGNPFETGMGGIMVMGIGEIVEGSVTGPIYCVKRDSLLNIRAAFLDNGAIVGSTDIFVAAWLLNIQRIPCGGCALCAQYVVPKAVTC